MDDIKIPALNYRPDRYKSQLKNPSDVWKISLVSGNSPERTDHPAQYPEELIERIIKAGTNPDETSIYVMMDVPDPEFMQTFGLRPDVKKAREDAGADVSSTTVITPIGDYWLGSN